jgi:hypothetical protein
MFPEGFTLYLVLGRGEGSWDSYLPCPYMSEICTLAFKKVTGLPWLEYGCVAA